jgi:hypothetical protein
MKKMATFKIVWEIELEAANPLEAAKEAQRWIAGNDWQYYVQNDETKEIFSVDLGEEDQDAVLPTENYEPLIENKS